MRQEIFKDVLYGVADLIGLDPSQDLGKDHARAIVRSMNYWTKEGWKGWPWAELNLTEERAFRQVFFSNVQYVRANPGPDELYYIDTATYYRVKPSAPADPPIGTLPTNTTYFEALPEPWERVIAYDQPGKQSIGMVRGVFNGDPRTSKSARGYGYEPSDNGIQVYNAGVAYGGTVWLRYQVRPSIFSAEEYDTNKTYKRGEVAYDPATGECYLALAPNHDVPANEPTKWKIQPMPECIAGYVKFMAAADQADDEQAKADLRSQALEAFGRTTDRTFEEGMAAPTYHRMALPRPRGGGPPNRNFIAIAS